MVEKDDLNKNNNDIKVYKKLERITIKEKEDLSILSLEHNKKSNKITKKPTRLTDIILVPSIVSLGIVLVGFIVLTMLRADLLFYFAWILINLMGLAGYITYGKYNVNDVNIIIDKDNIYVPGQIKSYPLKNIKEIQIEKSIWAGKNISLSIILISKFDDSKKNININNIKPDEAELICDFVKENTKEKKYIL